MSVQIDSVVFTQQLAMRGLRQDDLARLSGLSRSVVSAAARGRRISAPTFARIASALAAAPVIAPGAEPLLAAGAGAGAAAKTMGGRR